MGKLKFAAFSCVVLSMLLWSACSAGVVAAPNDNETRPGLAEPADVVASRENELPGNYYAAAYIGDGFLAAGTGGKLDHISMDGVVSSLQTAVNTDFLDIWTDETLTLVGGADGTILRSKDGQNFEPAPLEPAATVFGITSFDGCYYAGAQNGMVFRSADGWRWESTKLDTEYDIIGIAANDKMIMAITRETDYFISNDGISWNRKNYNQYYDGYSSPLQFSCIRNMGEAFFVAGQNLEDPDAPFVMYTISTDVWFMKPLGKINQLDPNEFFPLNINAIGHDIDQIIAACDNGRILTVTDCFECNELNEYNQEDLYDLAFGGGKLLAVGENYTFDIVDTAAVRQYSIRPEQALTNSQNGAVFVDVRTDEEYSEAHIPGAIHIPADEVRERLAREIPDTGTELIFYCSAGKRAQTALETALELGYQRVYNMGGLKDWPYETE